MSEPQQRVIREPWRSILVAVLTAVLTILGGGAAVQVSGCGRPPAMPQPEPPGRPDPMPPQQAPPDQPPQPWEAIGRLALSGSYCSATVVGPRRSDGRWWVISAAHCLRRAGEEATLTLRRGGTLRVTAVAIDRESDLAILLTEHLDALPYALLADATPAAGAAVWHGGYGRHQPGNREAGRVLSGPDPRGQVRYRLSVSPGDSGGGIIHTETGRLLSPVCCTTRLDAEGDVWGSSPERIQRLLAATAAGGDGLPPHEMPTRPPVP